VRVPFIVFVILFLPWISGCGVSQRYYIRLDHALAGQDYEGALEILKPEEYGDRNEVLYNLDRGTLLQLAEDFTGSITHFDRADKKMDELYTVSITKLTESFVVNDNAAPYEGEDFEKALVNMFQALNYIWLGDLDEALVECRRVNTKLGILNQKYEKKNIYREDAFVRYLAGILYEARGEDNDAYISYKKALKIYRTDYSEFYGTEEPPWLEEDMRRTGIRSGVLEREAGRVQEGGENGEIVVIFFNGLSPRKVEDHLAILLPGEKLAKIAFPVFQPVSRRATSARIYADGQDMGETVLAEDIEAIAIKNLEDRRGRAILKLGTRQAVKYLISKGIGDIAEKRARGMGQLVGFLASAALAAAEVADVRSWRTLPAQIQVGRFSLPSGMHEITIQPMGHGGFSSSPIVKNVLVRKGRITFVSARVND